MKNVLYRIGLFAILFLVFLSACTNEKTADEAIQAIDLPPSLMTEKGAEVQVIELKKEQARSLNIETIELRSDNFSYELTLPGIALPAPDRIFLVSTPINGRVVSMYAHEGETVHKGDLLLELESLEFANLVAEYLQTRAEKLYQVSQLERIKLLVDKKISPLRTLEKTQADFARANVAEQAAHARLLAIGVKQTQINDWDAGHIEEPRLKIFAPIFGVITEHLIDQGQAVNNYEKMLTIINLDKVLIKGYASPEDGILMKPGDPVKISQKDFPEQKLEAVVTTINPVLDPINKSISVNIITKTHKEWPKPGQKGRLKIRVTTPHPVLSLPLSGIEYEGDMPTVFVQIRPNAFEKRFIKVRKITGDAVIVDSGLSGSEIVAVSQVFSLKALGKFEEFSE